MCCLFCNCESAVSNPDYVWEGPGTYSYYGGGISGIKTEAQLRDFAASKGGVWRKARDE